MSSSYANLSTDEGTLAGEKIITFPWPAKKVTITNDSSTRTIQWKFKPNHDWASLKPYETVSMYVSVKQVILSGSNNAEYRLWGIG
jgi:cytochrome c oxidase assembly protein Cox11